MHREAAIARLRVAGVRALPRLRAFLDTASPPAARAAALSALEGIDDPRTIELALTVLDTPDAGVVTAALGVLRAWVAREEGTRVLDALAGVALDGSREGQVRLAALDALSDLPRHLVQPIVEQAAAADSRSVLDDAARVRERIASEGRTAPLSALHDLVVRAREHERSERSAHARAEWQGVRAALHGILAERGSRVALYDLRETFDTARGPLPHDFLAAVAAIGDASCLEPMARAWKAAEDDTWWRERVADAAADIVKRTRLNSRSVVMKRIRAKWPQFL